MWIKKRQWQKKKRNKSKRKRKKKCKYTFSKRMTFDPILSHCNQSTDNFQWYLQILYTLQLETRDMLNLSRKIQVIVKFHFLLCWNWNNQFYEFSFVLQIFLQAVSPDNVTFVVIIALLLWLWFYHYYLLSFSLLS